jgi:hypothetical protein
MTWDEKINLSVFGLWLLIILSSEWHMLQFGLELDIYQSVGEFISKYQINRIEKEFALPKKQ